MFLTIVDETSTELPFTNHTRRRNEVQGAGVTKFSQRIFANETNCPDITVMADWASRAKYIFQVACYEFYF